MKLIGLSGGAGAGKTSISNRLKMLLPNVHQVKLADTIYEMHNSIQSIAHKHDIPMADKDRKLLQFLGDEWGRQTFGDNIWVDLFIRKWEKVKDEEGYMIVDDVRYMNEVEAIQLAGGQVLWIDVPDRIRRNRIPDTFPEESHASEGILDAFLEEFDLVIDGTKELADITTFLTRYFKDEVW
jgi:dephospho-CoA kinase